MSATTSFIVGNGTTQQTVVNNGAIVASALVEIGNGAGGSGLLAIGSGGTVDSLGSIYVANSAGSTGTVAIGPGGTLEYTGTLNPNLYVIDVGRGAASGTTAAASGIIAVIGNGAVLTTNGNPARIGDTGSGTLLVTGGALASFGVSSDAATANSALSIGGPTGSGTVIVLGAGSTLDVAGGSYMAHAGTAALTVSNAATFLVGDTQEGLGIGEGGTNGSTGAIVVGGTAFALVSAGGSLFSSHNIAIGYQGSTGTLDVVGGKVEAADRIFVGDSNTIEGTLFGGTGLLLIGAGGTVQADGQSITTSGTSAFVIGDGAGSTGTVDVSGAGALLNTSGHYLTIGAVGTGSLTISQGGTVSVGTQFVANAAAVLGGSGGTGAVVVTDSGSDFVANGQLDVGTTGAGSLLVENAGTAITGGNTIAYGFVIGWGTASSGVVTVTGNGSQLSNFGRFDVGGSGNAAGSLGLPVGGPGTLLIGNGGDVITSRANASLSAPAADIAADPGTGGSSVTVTGSLSTWLVDGPLIVGDVASGTLSVLSGGTVSSGSVDAGVTAGSSGTIVVTGTGSQLYIDGLLSVGDSGTGVATIGGGASVSAGAVQVGAGDAIYLTGGRLSAAGGTIGNSGFISASANAAEISGSINGAGEVLVGGPLQIDGAVGAGQVFDFSQGTGTLTLEQPGSFAGTIIGFLPFDTIDAVGATSGSLAGDVLTLFSGAAAIGTLTFGTLGHAPSVSSSGEITAPCFLAGSRIRTGRGEIPVEALAVGDMAVTQAGATRMVRWIGERSIDCRRHARPELVWPIRIAAGAFADLVPCRDLFLSPDHAVYHDGMLIPAGRLVNGATVQQIRLDQVRYFHVELADHDVVLAEGLPVESYLDTGNRASFAGGAAALTLHPEFTARDWDHACAPLCLSGAPVVALRRMLLARAQALGHRLSVDAALQIWTGERVLRPMQIKGALHSFLLPRGARKLVLHSPSGFAGAVDPQSEDSRRLGALIGGVVLDGRAIDTSAFGAGFYPAEPEGRWTNGAGRLELASEGKVLDVWVRRFMRAWHVEEVRKQALLFGHAEGVLLARQKKQKTFIHFAPVQ